MILVYSSVSCGWVVCEFLAVPVFLTSEGQSEVIPCSSCMVPTRASGWLVGNTEVIQIPEHAIRRQAAGRSLLPFPAVSEEETATIRMARRGTREPSPARHGLPQPLPPEKRELVLRLAERQSTTVSVIGYSPKSLRNWRSRANGRGPKNSQRQKGRREATTPQGSRTQVFGNHRAFSNVV